MIVRFGTDSSEMAEADFGITGDQSHSTLSVQFWSNAGALRDPTPKRFGFEVFLPAGAKFTRPYPAGARLFVSDGVQAIQVGLAPKPDPGGWTNRPVLLHLKGTVAYESSGSRTGFIVPLVFDDSPGFDPNALVESFNQHPAVETTFEKVPDSSSLEWATVIPHRYRDNLNFERNVSDGGQEIEATDVSRVSNEQRDLFLSGALIAIAGGGLIAIVPEFTKIPSRRTRIARKHGWTV
jgi:hypothetical protein